MPTPGFALFALLAVVAGTVIGMSTTQPERGPAEWIVVGKLSELPNDGEPHLRAVMAAQVDAWRRLPDRPIGDVFLRRQPGSEWVTVLQARHGGDLRIPVEYDARAKEFRSCCWKVSFDLEGSALGGAGLYRNHMRRIAYRIVDDAVQVRSTDFADSE